MSLTVREQLQWPVQSEYTLPEESPYNNKSLAEIMHAGYALSEHTIIPSHFHHPVSYTHLTLPTKLSV